MVQFILLFGMGPDRSPRACDVALLASMELYGVAKGALICFLAERGELEYPKSSRSSSDAPSVHMVHTRGLVARHKSPAIQATGLVAIIMLGLGVWGVVSINCSSSTFLADRSTSQRQRISYITPEGKCYVGLHRNSTIPSTVVDLTVTFTLNIFFVIPVWRLSFEDARWLSLKSGFAALVSTGVTLANLGVSFSTHVSLRLADPDDF